MTMMQTNPRIAPTQISAPVVLPYSADNNLVKKLQRAREISRKRMAGARRIRLMLLKEYAGRNYGGMMTGQSKAEPLNFFMRTVASLLPGLVPNNVKYGITSQNIELRQSAEIFTLAINHLMKRTGVRTTVRDVVLDAIMMLGVIKQGITSGRMVEIEGTLHDAGQPFLDRVSFDNYFIDPSARKREEAWFEGDDYLLPLDFVRSCDSYENTDLLRSDCDKRKGEEAADLSLGDAKDYEIEEIVPMVRVADVYIPQENLMVTMPIEESQGTKPLRIVEWEGPKMGPYDTLFFHAVPDNILALSPGSVWYELHQMINASMRRIMRDATSGKRIIAYRPDETEGAEEMKNAEHGDYIRVRDTNNVKEINIGGASESSYRELDMLRGLFQYQAGNPDLTGGLGTPNTDTATGASIIQGNNQFVANDLKDIVSAFELRAVEKYAWWVWYDPLMNMVLARRDESGQDVQVVFDDAARRGDFLDYEFNFVTNSMENMDPVVRAKRIQDLVTGVVVPTTQLAMAQGKAPDIAQIVKDLATAYGIHSENWYISQQQLPPTPEMVAAGMIPPGSGRVVPPSKGGPGNPNNPDNPQFIDPRDDQCRRVWEARQ
jgi:hypothetical protein